MQASSQKKYSWTPLVHESIPNHNSRLTDFLPCQPMRDLFFPRQDRGVKRSSHFVKVHRLAISTQVPPPGTHSQAQCLWKVFRSQNKAASGHTISKLEADALFQPWKTRVELSGGPTGPGSSLGVTLGLSVLFDFHHSLIISSWKTFCMSPPCYKTEVKMNFF